MNVLLNAENKVATVLSYRRMQRVAREAYTVFAQQHPLWAATLHDEQFFMRGVTSALMAGDGRLTPPALAEAWAGQMWHRDEAMRQRIIARLLPAASAFIEILTDSVRHIAVVDAHTTVQQIV